MFYPLAVVVVAFIITCILMIFVIPQFQDLFSGFGADLPALTMVVINMSKWFQANWYFLIGGNYRYCDVSHSSPQSVGEICALC